MNQGQYIVLRGSLKEGFDAFGPFNTEKEAYAFDAKWIDEGGHIIQIYTPDNDGIFASLQSDSSVVCNAKLQSRKG